MPIRRDPHTRDFPAKIPQNVGPPPKSRRWRAMRSIRHFAARSLETSHRYAFNRIRVREISSHALFASSHRRRRRRAHGRLQTIIRARSPRASVAFARRHPRPSSARNIRGADRRRSGARCARCAVGYMIGGKKHASLRIDARARGRSRDDAGADVDRVDGIRTRMWIARGLEAMGRCM